MTNRSRRSLLRGDIRAKRLPIRPPWALDEAAFTTGCDRCNACIQVCPDGVIARGSGGFPEMRFGERGCSLCGDCVTACRGKALRREPAGDQPWETVAVISGDCLAERGVVCRSCGEVCDELAIRFEPRIGGAALPRLNTDRCNGCGCCVGVCPGWAVSIRPFAKDPGAAARKAVSPADHVYR